MAPSLHMRLLGGFALEHEGERIVIASPRLQALLAYLALHRGGPQPRRRLAFLLWPDSSEAQAQTNLRTVLHRLQATLPAISQLLSIDAQALSWRPGHALALDVDAFQSAARDGAAAAAEEAAIAALERAAGLYVGDLLPDCYDEWAQPVREGLWNTLLDVLGHLVRLLEGRRDYPAAIAHARRLAHLDPLNEAAQLTLMRLHALSGDQSGALRVYHACATTLQRELGASPGAALHSAYEQLVAAAPPAPGEREGSGGIPFIGREDAWRRVQAAWQQAAAGQPTLLLLAGEAGIGKTRLAEELVRWAARQGVITASAHCYPAEGALPYAPVVAWLRAEGLRPRLRQLGAAWLEEVGRLDPELAAGQGGRSRPGPLTEAWQRQRLFEALARATLAAERPTLLLLDDLQWCDRDTLEWLHYLLRFNPAARLLLVGTVRVEELDDAHPLAALLEALRRAGRAVEVPIGPLSSDQSAELAARIAGRPLADDEPARVFAEAEGNPLFITEMLRAGLARVVHGGPAALAGGSELPAGVQAVLARRLQQVTGAARELLGVAAVIGRSFTFDVLARAAGLDEDSLVRGLDELWRRRIVREQGAEAYDFTHQKLRAVAYHALNPARRRLLHGRVAAALEEVYAANLDAVSGQIAAHYERAGMLRQAAAYECRVAEAALSLYANIEAVEHYRRALSLLGANFPAESAPLRSRLGDLLHLLGRYGDAREAWGRALADTPTGDRVELAHLQRKIGNAFRDEYRYEEAGRAYDAAEVALASQRGNTDERSTLAWAQVQLDWITLDYWLGEIDRMLRRVERVRPRLESVGDPALRARLYQISAIALLRRVRFTSSPEAIGYARAYLDMVEAIGDSQAAPAARFQLGIALFWSGDLAGAEQQMSSALALAERSGDTSLQGRCLTYLTIIARLRGDVEQVRALAERSLQVAEAGQMHDYIGAAHGNMAWLAWRAGDLAGVRSQGERALEAWQKLPAGYICAWTARWPLIATCLAQGDTARAVEHARGMLDQRQQRPPPALEAALEAAVQAAEGNDLAAAHVLLVAAQAPARALGYL